MLPDGEGVNERQHLGHGGVKIRWNLRVEGEHGKQPGQVRVFVDRHLVLFRLLDDPPGEFVLARSDDPGGVVFTLTVP